MPQEEFVSGLFSGLIGIHNVSLTRNIKGGEAWSGMLVERMVGFRFTRERLVFVDYSMV